MALTDNNSALSVWDTVGSFLEKGVDVATTVYLTEAQRKAAEKQAKADAERAKADAAQAKQNAATPTSSSGGIPPMVLYGAAAVVGLGVIIWAATRKS